MDTRQLKFLTFYFEPLLFELQVYGQFNGHMARLGLDHVTFHDLRRTFASLHVSHGTPIYHVAKWLGDEISVVEGTYGHLLPSDARINDPWNSARSQG